jgi:hypothetical protein
MSSKDRSHPKLKVQTGAETFVVPLFLQGVLRLLFFTKALWHACTDLHEANHAAYNSLDDDAKKKFCSSNWSFVVSRQTTHPLFAARFNEACCDAWGKGAAFHRLLSAQTHTTEGRVAEDCQQSRPPQGKPPSPLS